MAIKFRGVDFIEFDSLLTDDERLVRDTTRKFIEDNLIPIIEECNRDGRFPGTGQAHGRAGLLWRQPEGLRLRRACRNVEYGLVMQELERGDTGVRSFVSVQSALVMYPIYAFGSDEQKDKWLPAMAEGRKARLLRPDRARLRLQPRRHAHPRPQRRRRNTSSTARRCGSPPAPSPTSPSSGPRWRTKTNKIRGFLVETDRPGFRADDVHGKWSLRASVTSGLSLQDVRIPASNLLPGTGGLKSPLMCLNQARYGIAWGAIGAAMACYDCALQYSLFRKQFRDQPIASHQLVQEKLAWMITEITKASCWRCRSDA